ncbi:hypothetical protein M1M97_02230 [Thermodesulfovibrionales bacterium]|nr:hypothetical protein [Thermodesulfovibrionales bacterium]
MQYIDMSPGSWRRHIDSTEDKKSLDEMRRYTLTGRPLGTHTFVEKLKKRFGRRLIALPRGRPRKK